MSRLDVAIDGLKRFSEEPAIRSIRELLKAIRKNEYHGDFEALRQELKTVFSRAQGELFQATHNGLLALAQVKPLNTECPITWLPITLNSRVVISSGHQFNIEALLEYHHQREPRRGEAPKRLLNPLTNSPFSTLDTAYITEKANKRGLTVELVKPTPDTSNFSFFSQLTTRPYDRGFGMMSFLPGAVLPIFRS